jgi:hypothetical protein
MRFRNKCKHEKEADPRGDPPPLAESALCT